MLNSLHISALSLALLACVGGQPNSDGPTDSFLASGKADGLGFVDGSAEALAVLRVANLSTFDALDNEAGLDRRAATNIIDYRAGADELLDTGDDATFDSLAQLDAIGYVGPVAFSSLLEYAIALGYVDERDIASDEDGDKASLALVNQATIYTLDDTAEVGLDRRAARAIVAYRDGPDFTLGTSDDNPFDTIAELDAVSYVGGKALAKIRSYALENGFLPAVKLPAGDYQLSGCGIGFENGTSLKLRSAAGRLFVMSSSRAYEVDENNEFSFQRLGGCGYEDIYSGKIDIGSDTIDVRFQSKLTYSHCSGTTSGPTKFSIVGNATMQYDRTTGRSEACQVRTLPVQLHGTVGSASSSTPVSEYVVLKEFEGKQVISWRRAGTSVRWSDNIAIEANGSFQHSYYSDRATTQLHFFNGSVEDGYIEARSGTYNSSTRQMLVWDVSGFYDPAQF